MCDICYIPDEHIYSRYSSSVVHRDGKHLEYAGCEVPPRVHDDAPGVGYRQGGTWAATATLRHCRRKRGRHWLGMPWIYPYLGCLQGRRSWFGKRDMHCCGGKPGVRSLLVRSTRHIRKRRPSVSWATTSPVRGSMRAAP